MKRTMHLTGVLAGAGLMVLVLMLTMSAQRPAHAGGSIIHVPKDYHTIRAAISHAADGDEIRVKEGIYLENLSISKGITLSGGWNASFTKQKPGYSTIDGQGSGRVISITCATSNTVVTIDGFTVQGGNATGLGGGPTGFSAAAELAGHGVPPAPDPLTPVEHVARLGADLSEVVQQGFYPGGSAAYLAMLDRVQQRTARLARANAQPQTTTIPAQQAADCGGGIYSWNASLHLLRSTLLGSVGSLQGDGCGGGVFVGQSPPNGVRIQGNTLRDNIASAAPGAEGYGGGLYAVQTPALVVEDNVFELNAGTSAGLFSIGEGGGLFVASSPDAVITHNQVRRNTANGGWQSYQGLGGGALLLGVDGATVTHNQFDENLGILHGGGGGGGLAVARSARVVVADNDVTSNWGCMFQMEGLNAGGGGIALYFTDAIVVTGNVIRDNTATVSGAGTGFTAGGGLDGQSWNGGRVADNTFSGNVACQTGIGRGGGASLLGVDDAEVSGNTFTGNIASVSQAYGAGGGAFLLNTRDCRIRSNTFRANLAAASGQGHGGGLCVREEGPETWHTTVDANLFLDNQADADSSDAFPSDGGACSISTNGLTFTNNVVAGNRADLGGGLYLPFAQDGVVTNNTLVGNSDAAIVVDQYNLTPITITNNIIVSHTVGISVTEGATATVSFTLWHANGADIAGAGIVTQTHPVLGDPAFADPAADDYHLTIASAARDAGDPTGVPPAPEHDADNVPRPQGPRVDIGAYEWKGRWLHLPLVFRSDAPRVGWAIGWDENFAAAIAHTADGGLTWQAQGDLSAWTGVQGTDISAVDDLTAWATLGSGGSGDASGAILHTTDGGATWVTQTIPAGLSGGMKSVKGLSRHEAWAASLTGTLLHTLDGGNTWNVVPHPTAPITEVNRMDAMGPNVWVADASAGGALVYSPDAGQTWQAIGLPGDSPLTVHAFSPQGVWASGSDIDLNPTFYRTVDGGLSWVKISQLGALDHLDDVCAASPNDAWGVQNGDGLSGRIWLAQVAADGTADAQGFAPPELAGYTPGGVTCTDANVAWVVAQKGVSTAPDKPLGIILHTVDGEHWVQQSAPTNIRYWKVTFAGARR